MRKYASAYSNSRSMSLQEAVSYSIPELWLRKCFPKTVFVSTSLPSQRIRMCKSREEIDMLDPDSTDIFKQNVIDRYVDRPDESFMNGKYRSVNNLCLATFIAHYCVVDLENNNDYQPEILEEFDSLNLDFSCLPLIIPLMSSKKKKMKLKKIKHVLCYHVPNKHLKPENFAHYLLFLF